MINILIIISVAVAFYCLGFGMGGDMKEASMLLKFINVIDELNNKIINVKED